MTILTKKRRYSPENINCFKRLMETENWNDIYDLRKNIMPCLIIFIITAMPPFLCQFPKLTINYKKTTIDNTNINI